MSSTGTPSSYTDYIIGSVGINVPQVVVAGLEEAVLSNMNMKNSLLMAASVGVSNLLPTYTDGKWSSSTEKYIAEPLLAGLLYTLGTKYVTSSGEKEKSMAKKFAKGFIVGASSAAVSGALYSSTLANKPVPSMYSTKQAVDKSYGGLRSAANLPETAKSFIVS